MADKSTGSLLPLTSLPQRASSPSPFAPPTVPPRRRRLINRDIPVNPNSRFHHGTLKTPVLIGSFLFVLIVTSVATLIILVVSHNDRPRAWAFQPSVVLSLLSSIYSIALGGLFLLGVAITWWRSLSHGTTLKRLHYTFTGTGLVDFIPAFRVGGHARRVTVAALIVFFARVAIGPLLQRATRVRDRDVQRDMIMGIYIVQKMPDGWYGTWDHFDFAGINAVQDTILNNTMTISLPSNSTQALQDEGIESLICQGNGTCSGVVRGAGLNYAITTDTRTMDFADPDSIGQTVFGISFEMAYRENQQPMLHFEAEYVSHIDENCVATVTTDSVYLVPATVPYPVSIRSRTLTLDSERLIASLLDPNTVVENYNSKADEKQPAGSTEPLGPLKGAEAGISQIYQTKAVLTYTSESDRIGFIATDEPYYTPYWPTIFVIGDAKIIYPDICPIVFTSPTQNVLAHLMEYAFRSAFAAAADSVNSEDSNSEDVSTIPNLQPFTARFAGTELHHITDFAFLAVAAVVMVAGIAAALSVVWGFWQLDRFVTLSPLETGKALGAPILSQAGPCVNEADGILKAVGNERVAHDGKELIWSETVYGIRPVRLSHDARTLRPSMDTYTAADVEIVSPASGIAGNRNTRADSLTLGLHIPAPPATPTATPTPRPNSQYPISPISTSPSSPSSPRSRRWGAQFDSATTLVRFPTATSQTPLVSRRGTVDSGSLPSPIPLSLIPGRGGVPELPPLPAILRIGNGKGKGKMGRRKTKRFYTPGAAVSGVSAGEKEGGGAAGVKRHSSLIERISRLAP